MKRETRKLVRRMKFHRLASATTPTSAATISPARTPGVAAALAISRIAPIRSSVRQASPNSNLRLKSMLLHAPVERTAREAELGGGERHIEMVHPQRALDHLLLELIEVQAVADHRERCRFRTLGQREVADVIALAVRHDHRPLGSMPQRADVAGPVVPNEQFEDVRRQFALRLVVLARVEAEIMVEQLGDVFTP